MAGLVASSRPFDPPVHVLVLPTRLPLDLISTFRDISEDNLVTMIRSVMRSVLTYFDVWQNDDNLPDHMHLLTLSEAFAHVSITLN